MLQPAVREFLLVVDEEFQHWPDLLEVRAFRDLVCLLVPGDESVVLQFRKVNVVHLHESCEFFIRRFVCIDEDQIKGIKAGKKFQMMNSNFCLSTVSN